MSLLNTADAIYLGGRAVDAVHANGVRVWPPAVAVAEDFFTGDGVTQQTRLQLAGHAVTNPIVTAMHQTDWQGRVALSSSPRTNLVYPSSPGSSWGNNYNYNSTGATPMATSSVTGPDGVANSATRYLVTASSAAVNANGPFYNANPDTVVAGHTYCGWIFARGVQGGEIINQLVEKASPSSPQSVTLTTEWKLIQFQYTKEAAGGALTFYLSNSFTNQVGYGMEYYGLTVLDITGGSPMFGVVIPTTTAPVTVTDYAVDSSGDVTLGQPTATAGTLDWDGTGLLVD